MPLIIASHRTPRETLRQRYDEVLVLDMTSRGPEPWVRFSPFYPHGGIPVPFSPDHVSATVEGIWQGLKVFERADVDPSRLTVTAMKGIKRSARVYGKVLGHRAGLDGDRLLSYGEARHAIYLPSYRWVLEHRLQDALGELRRLAASQMVLLLDYETNCDVNDLTRPLSHACLVKRYLEDDWPTEA
jgi:hypothetical protein